MEENDLPQRGRMLSETEAIAEQLKTANALEKAYPETIAKKKSLRRLVSRLGGKIPDAYDVLPAMAELELHEVLDAHLKAHFEGKTRVDGQAKPDWDRMLNNPVIDFIMDLSVSMGNGKGRREDVELGKTTPTQSPGRWSLPRRRE